MKWIGQHVWDYVSRFRNHVYFEDNVTLSSGKSITMDEYTSGTISITKIQDSGTTFNDNDTSLMTAAAIADKIEAYGYSTTTGDITGVTITTDTGGGSAASDTGGSADFSILSGTGIGVTNSGATITVGANSATTDDVGVVELATTAETTAGTSSTLAVTPDGLNESAITLSGLTLDGDKSITPGDGAMIHLDTSTITDSNTSGSGTATMYNHVTFEGPTLAATNSSVTTTHASTLYITAATAGTNQTITNNWGIYNRGGLYTTGLTVNGNYSQTAGDMTLYDATNDGNPTISLGSSATERLEIKAEYESGAQGLDVVKFITHTAGSSSDDARYAFQVDETFILGILDAGIRIKASGELEIGSGNTILSDSSGTTTLSNIDAIDATTESTIESAIDTLSNLTTVGTIGTGVWQGTAIAHAYIGADAIEGDNIADDAINSEHYTDGSIDTAHIGDDQVTFAKVSGVVSNIFGSTIKLLPSDFQANIDGGNTKFGVGYTDTAGSAYGMKVANANTELYAFVSIPEGMKATHVDIYDKDDLAIEVFEVQINATTMTSKGSGNCNTTLDITDVNATATNFLAILITTTATTNKIFGGKVTIAAQ